MEKADNFFKMYKNPENDRVFIPEIIEKLELMGRSFQELPLIWGFWFRDPGV